MGKSLIKLFLFKLSATGDSVDFKFLFFFFFILLLLLGNSEPNWKVSHSKYINPQTITWIFSSVSLPCLAQFLIFVLLDFVPLERTEKL